MSKIVAIIGPTASGKSEIALKIAQKTGAEILSCDSLLVYKELNIGTAKPTQEELKKIPHYGINLISLNETFNAGDYVRYARAVIEEVRLKQKSLLIVGGTGFYLKALLCGVWDTPPTQDHIRAKLEPLTSEELYEKLLQLDLEYAQKIKAQDRYRVIRALEIIEVTKEKLSELLKHQKNQNELPYPVEIVGIKRNKQELERRIIERTNKMFSKGIVEETMRLLKENTDTESSNIPKGLLSVGYKEVIEFLNEQLSLPECRQRVVISTRQLAKKQMTFFKTFPKKIEWFLLPTQEQELEDKILQSLKPS